MKRLGTKLAVLVIPILLIGIALLVAVLNAGESERLGRFLTREARSYAVQYAVAAGRRLESGLNAAETLAAIFARSAGSSLDRERAVTYLRDAMEGFPEIAAAWSLWEPGAFDGADAREAGSALSRPDGRFAPVWHLERGLAERALVLDEGGEAYDLAKSLSEPVLVEPRAVSYSGASASAGSFVGLVAPILRDGTFLGVVGIDIPLSRIGSYIMAQKPVGSGFAFLAGNSGRVLVHPDASLAGKALGELHPEAESRDGVSDAVARGAELSFRGLSPSTGKSAMTALAPVAVGTCRRPWAVGIEIPLALLFVEVERARAVAIGLALAVIAGAAVAVFLFARAAARPVALAAGAIRDIAEGDGDLTRSLAIRRNDEVGELADSFNRFTEKLRLSIGRVQESTLQLAGAGTELSGAMDRSSEALDGILRGIERAREGAAGQSGAAAASAQAIRTIAVAAESFRSLVAEQSTALSESSAAIEETIANVRSIAATMQTLAERYGALVGAGEDGKSRLAAVDERIAAIAARSSRLLEANELLASIADRSNLLAMNAAIEAAHAGESGKGFAVVAEEIRALAEGSAEHTDLISKDLAAVEGDIAGIVEAGRASTLAFERVLSLIGDVESLVSGARDALVEQDRGSSRVLGSLTGLADSASRVDAASGEISLGSTKALAEIERLAASSRGIGEEMEANARAAEGIGESTRAVRELVARTARAIETVKAETDRFKCAEGG